MPAPRRFDLDELTLRPGTYVNPQTEVLIIVDDSAEVDQSSFPPDDAEGADWVLVADEAPVDEAARDELLERFSVRYHEGGAPSATDDGDDPEDPDDVLDEDPEEL
jgi:hypothetical protein